MYTDDYPEWISLREAQKHERATPHVLRVRALDRAPLPTAPLLSFHSSSPIPGIDSDTAPIASSIDRHALPSFIPNEDTTVAGQCIAGEPPDQIYNDREGEWHRGEVHEP